MGDNVNWKQGVSYILLFWRGEYRPPAKAEMVFTEDVHAIALVDGDTTLKPIINATFANNAPVAFKLLFKCDDKTEVEGVMNNIYKAVSQHVGEL
jgi:hypothetical protein